MRERVVAELEAIVEPKGERFDARVDFARLIELALVDETYGWNFLGA